jgi:hypothetical protein
MRREPPEKNKTQEKCGGQYQTRWECMSITQEWRPLGFAQVCNYATQNRIFSSLGDFPSRPFPRRRGLSSAALVDWDRILCRRDSLAINGVRDCGSDVERWSPTTTRAVDWRPCSAVDQRFRDAIADIYGSESRRVHSGSAPVWDIKRSFNEDSNNSIFVLRGVFEFPVVSSVGGGLGDCRTPTSTCGPWQNLTFELWKVTPGLSSHFKRLVRSPTRRPENARPVTSPASKQRKNGQNSRR